MMSKPKYTVILTGLFCSVVADGTSHFYSIFSRKYFGKSKFFGMTTFTSAWQVKSSRESRTGNHDSIHFFYDFSVVVLQIP